VASVHLTKARLSDAGIGVFFRPGQLDALGITYHQLRRLEASGEVEHVARGLYRLADVEVTEHYSLAAACARVPRSIICLLSALRVHGIGSEAPHEVWLAIPHKARPPRSAGVKIRLLRFSGPSWTFGIENTAFDGVPARITNPTRTVVDCFRFERLVGREVGMNALRDVLRRKMVTTDALLRALDVLPSRLLRNALDVIDQGASAQQGQRAGRRVRAVSGALCMRALPLSSRCIGVAIPVHVEGCGTPDALDGRSVSGNPGSGFPGGGRR